MFLTSEDSRYSLQSVVYIDAHVDSQLDGGRVGKVMTWTARNCDQDRIRFCRKKRGSLFIGKTFKTIVIDDEIVGGTMAGSAESAIEAWLAWRTLRI